MVNGWQDSRYGDGTGTEYFDVSTKNTTNYTSTQAKFTPLLFFAVFYDALANKTKP